MRRPLLAVLATCLVTIGLVPVSSAAFTSTSASAPSGVTAAADWTAPSVSLRDPGAALRGAVTVTADATDGETSVAHVVHQRRAVGSDAWIDTCTVTATGSVFACVLPTLALADGPYELRAVASDAVGNRATSPVRSTTVDNLAPEVELDELLPAVRGTVDLGVTATDAGSGVVAVRLQRSPADGSTWTDVCTTTTAPYRCALPTAGLPDDDLDLRAVATDAAGNTATSEIVTVLVDNRAPTVAVSAPAGTLSGTTTIAATASDTHSGVAAVDLQRRLQGTGAWVTICIDVTSPYTCRFDTTQVPAGTYEFRAVATDVAGNSATSGTLVRGVANTATSVSVEDPGDLLSGTVPVDASAFSPLGVRHVRIQRAVAGTTTWVDLCVDEAAPYRCDWDTTTVPDGAYDLRATVTDVNGVATTSATVPARQVDNSPLRGVDVQGAAVVNGRIDAGDVLTVTYSDLLDLTSVIGGWRGAPRAVSLRLRDGAVLGAGPLDDTLDVLTGTGPHAAPVPIGTLNLRADLVKQGRIVTLAGTLTAGTTHVDGRAVTTLSVRFDETPANHLARTGGAGTMVWTPSTAVRDLRGLPASRAPVTETGPLDRDV